MGPASHEFHEEDCTQLTLWMATAESKPTLKSKPKSKRKKKK